ncbi:MAG: hypothetical protein JXA73_11240 [Acidobacteria bacterium]|nr:hypothetical protein [Acidobacteriota bacterium]
MPLIRSSSGGPWPVRARCWDYSIEVGKNGTCPALCERCVPAIKEIYD